MYKPLQAVAFVTLLSLAAFGAIAYDPPPDAVAQPGDPARWYRPADTPQKLYHTAMKEAGAALKIALDDCRGAPRSDRSECIAEARRTYQEDVEAARSLR